MLAGARDNAVSDTFYVTFEAGWVHRGRWTGLQHVYTELCEDIERFYERKKFHSAMRRRMPRRIQQALGWLRMLDV